jgi:hypothetical protein
VLAQFRRGLAPAAQQSGQPGQVPVAFVAGRFRGARAIIEEYGCTEEEAMAIMELHNTRHQKGRAA